MCPPKTYLRSALCGLFLSAIGASAPAALAQRAPSLATHVPQDSNLFVELYGLGRLPQMQRLEDVDRLLGVPVRAGDDDADMGPWLGRIKAVANIDRHELIQSYFGEQVAVAAPSWDALAEGVLLARVSDRAKIDALFARARGPVLTLPGDARICALRDEADGLWLAGRGDVIVLGPNPAPATGMSEASSYFFRIATHIAEGGDGLPVGSLPEARADGGVAGRVFLRRGRDTRPAVSAADHMIDGLLQQAESISATIELTGAAIHVRAAGTTAGGRAHLRAPGTAMLRVPTDALATWRFGYDFREALQSRADSSISAQVRFLLTLADGATPDVSLAGEFIPTLGPDAALVIGQASAAGGATRFDLPTITFATRTSDSDMATRVVRQLVARVAEVFNFQLRRANSERRAMIRRESHAGVEIETLPVGAFLATISECEFFAALDLSWCVLDGWLVISSHPGEVRRIIDANRDDDAGSASVTPVAPAPAGAGERVTFRPRATAALLHNWVRYLKAEHPHVLEDGWWELVKQRRSGTRVELGIGTKADPTQPGKVHVALTLDGWPASGLVREGDYIIGVDGQLLSTTDAVSDFRRLIQLRKHLDYTVLRVERDGRLRDVRIGIPAGPGGPVADQNPAQLLEPLAGLLERFESATYELTFEDADRFVADISLTLPARDTPQDKATTVMVAPLK